MTNDITRLLRPNIAALQPYASARDEFQGQASIFLDANENSAGSPLGGMYHRYPDPRQDALRQAIGRWRQQPQECIFLGNGSDEAIDLLLRAFVRPELDHILLLPPTYGMYSVQARIHGCEIRQVPLRPDFSPDTEALRAALREGPKIVFLCSPNNPTGQCLPADFIEMVLAEAPGLVVIDEAYVDFSEKPSWLERLQEFPQLVVLQTLSKAWGLAALRVGMAFASAAIIGVLQKIKYPYNISLPAAEMALKALNNTDFFEKTRQMLRTERQRLSQALAVLPAVNTVFPSDANFLLVRVRNADQMWAQLVQNGLIVRNRSREIHCDNCLRITIGTPEENEKLRSLVSGF
jgi:histidinol-phosphate aminotransferase